MPSSITQTIKNSLADADITINGSRPWDIQVHNDKLYSRVLRQGSLGLGEAYMDGWWDAESLDDFYYHILASRLEEKFSNGLKWVAMSIAQRLFNYQGRGRAFVVGEKHYDLGNDLYLAMLDKRLTYTCGYWPDAHNLDEAQVAKLDLVCRKLNLKPGQRILDIGCGWGSFMKYAAEKYGVEVVGLTVSKEQVALGQTLCAGLPVEFRLEDYRVVRGEFDHVVSLGMFEHVGYKNARAFMGVARRSLKNNGLFLLHTIGWPISGKTSEPWIDKYIFPNHHLPSLAQITRAAEKIFIVEDIQNFGADYDKTACAWFQNFNQNWPALKTRYDERFYRMWKNYLLLIAALARARQIQLWQIIFLLTGFRVGIRQFANEVRVWN